MAINKAMVKFCGRLYYKVKLPNKPIKEGYKIWALANGSIILD